MVLIATSDVFRTWWLPACDLLGLELISHFHDGTFTEVAREDVPRIAAELETLRAWASSASERNFMVSRIDGVLQAFRESDPAQCVYDFG
ncbi:Hypothetical protein A7982_01256 [Minicystis rosea]|nr:Hypothetical protein A7982_01256 [Minicystis rosea]